MHRCFNILEICPGPESQARQTSGSFFNLPGDDNYLEKFRQGFRLGNLKHEVK